MRGKTHDHVHAAHMGKHRAKGGNVEKSGIKKAGGNPYVEREAEETSERKHGGHIKKRKHGGHIDGKKMKHRMDRKAGGRAHHEHEKRAKDGEYERARGGHVDGEHHEEHKRHRARGGRTGSDKSPLSSANKVSGPEPQPKTQQGGMSR